MNSSAQVQGGAKKGALLFVFITIFIDMLGVGILIPVTPYIVRQFNSDALTIGLLSVVYSAFQFLASPILGSLSDRYGRRPLLLISLFGTAIGYFVFGLAGALWVLFLARVIDGITGGNISIAQAYIADITPPQDRSKNFGLIGAAFGLGFIFGPAFGGVLSNISLSAPAFFAGFLALANVALGFFMLPESLPAEKRAGVTLSPADFNPLRSLMEYIRRPEVAILFFAIFAFNFAFSGLQTNFSVFTLDRFEWGPTQNALLFSFIGIVGAVMQGGVVRRLVPRFGDRKLAIAGLAIMSVSFLLIALVRTPWVLFPVLTLTSIGSSLATPTLTGMVSNQVSMREQGAILGATQSVNALTRVFGPVWAGLAFDFIGQGAPYWTGAIWIAVALFVVIGVGSMLKPAAQARPQTAPGK